jgi:hypothetical protein
VGGTSASSPSFASLLALVIQQQSGTRQGNANTIFYPMGNNQYAGSSAPAAFHDITTANNTVPGVTGFAAVTGYDRATGLGSVNVNSLVTNWGVPGFSAASGSGSATVTQGSSVNVDINTTVINGFSALISLSASGLPSGVTASFNPNPLAAPGSGTSVLTLTAAANAAVGTVTVTVTAAGEGISHATTFSLTVNGGSGVLARSGWRVLWVDSQATDCGNYGATNAFDGNGGTMWITEWCNSTPPTPHEIQIDLGASYTIGGLPVPAAAGSILGRQHCELRVLRQRRRRELGFCRLDRDADDKYFRQGAEASYLHRCLRALRAPARHDRSERRAMDQCRGAVRPRSMSSSQGLGIGFGHACV